MRASGTCPAIFEKKQITSDTLVCHIRDYSLEAKYSKMSIFLGTDLGHTIRGLNKSYMECQIRLLHNFIEVI